MVQHLSASYVTISSSNAEDGPGFAYTPVGHVIQREFALGDIIGMGVIQRNASAGGATVIHEVLHQGGKLAAEHREIKVLHKGADVAVCACDLLALPVLPEGVDVLEDCVSNRHHGIPPVGAQGATSAVNAKCGHIDVHGQCQDQESGDDRCCRALHLEKMYELLQNQYVGESD